LSLTQLAALNPKIKLSRLSVGMILKVQSDRRQAKSAVPETDPEASVPESSQAVVRVPIPALPTIPALGPATLVHLERMLPSKPQSLAPTSSFRAESPLAFTPVSTSEQLQPVPPPATGLEYESQIAADLGSESG